MIKHTPTIAQRHVSPKGPRAAKTPVPMAQYAAFLFVPGREFLLMGRDHPSVNAAKAHLEGLVQEKYRDATELWVVEIKARALRRFAPVWMT